VAAVLVVAARNVGAADRPAGTIVYEAATCEYADSEETCSKNLWSVDVGTGREKLLTRASGGGFGAAWSPDGSKIAFTAGNDFAIWSMNADGSGARRVGRKFDSIGTPAWSPDGRRIAYEGGNDNNDLVVMNADGSGRRVLTSMPAGAAKPSWSPDGKTIAFLTFGFGNPAIHLVDADGRDARELARARGGPAWSPDGRWLAFSQTAIYVIRPDGSGRRAVTGRSTNLHSPTWSPDGTKIAYARLSDDVHVIRVGGGGWRRLSAGGDPSWSPDGRFIAAAKDYYGGGIVVVRADGTGLRQLTRRNYAAEPVWRPTR
jgi:TolB protein